MAYSQFSFVPSPTGTLPGDSFVQQTEDAINALGQQVYEVIENNVTLAAQVQQAIATANSAQNTASTALTNSQNALSQLDTLTVTVNTYDQKITQAVSQATSAVQTATAAQESAQAAQESAQAAQTAAETASSQAQQAQASASEAQAQAEAAQTAAEAAQDQATDASNSAQQAQQQAQQAQQNAESAANSAATLAQNAVMVTEQDFADDQQLQARTNIGAAASDNSSLTGTTTAEDISASGTVTATGGFVGNLTGTASQATADGNGNNIAATYATIANTYTKEQVDAKVSSVYRFMGSVATYDDLPTSGQTVGDTYNVEDTGANYAWTGTAWDKLSETIDLSQYLTIASAQSTYLPLAGGTMTGPLILNANPTNALGAATKQYVDSAVSSGTANSVLYTQQSLSTSQQTQARSNIGVVTLTNDGVQVLGSNVDYNTVLDPGFYHVNQTGATNGPGEWANKLLVLRQSGASYITQVAFPVTITNGAIPTYRVTTNGGTSWTAWTEFITDYLSYDAQTLTSEQQTQAQTNIGGPFLPLAGGTMTGNLILNANPTTALGAATKQYVDSAVSTGTSDAVLYTAQTLSSSQQTQARANIGALGETEKANSATTADQFSANRTISLSGAVTGSASSNFSGNVSISTTYTLMGGATASAGGSAGAVPAPAAGENDEFLRGDGTWTFPPNNAVLQTASSANGNYPILLKETTGTSTTTDGSIFDANVFVNPSTGVLTANGFVGNLTGNASTASEWATARTITLSGDATGSVSIDGSANATLNLTIANSSVTNAMLAASSVTFSKVASGDVATQAEAEAGTANNSFMTPLRVAQAIAALGGAGKAYITDTYNDGSGNWYRVWSDGWIEQGGTFDPTASNHVLTFVTPFSGTEYTIVAMVAQDQANDAVIGLKYISKSTSSINLKESYAAGGSGQAANPYMWYGCGY